MLNLLKKNIILISVLLVVIVVFVYFFFIRSSVPVDTTIAVDSSNIVGQDIIALVDKFENVSIDTSLFSSSLFTNLKDTSATVIAEPQGRSNPFVLIGVESFDTGSAETKSQSSTVSKTSITTPSTPTPTRAIPGL